MAGGALALGLFWGGAAAPQGARPGTDPQVLNQFEQTFKQMLANPADLDVTFRYAELAIQVGDFEAAISALERMLLFNPDLPRVRLELGVLYFRLGSYAVARSYLQRAIEGPNVPDDVRSRVAIYLAEIDKRMSPHQLAGSIYGGVRYQTNANAGPERSAITLRGVIPGGQFDLDGRFTKKNDWNLFASGSLRHTYDPQLQSGDVLVTEATVYAAKQLEQDQLDLLFIELTFGPRGQFFRDGLEGVSYRPYVLVDYVGLEDSLYFYAPGAGINFTKQFTPAFIGEANFQAKDKTYSNTARRPNADDQDGPEYETRFDVRYQLTNDIALSGGAFYRSESAELKFHSNDEVGLTAGVVHVYAAPFGLTTQDWTSSLTGVWQQTSYHEPDPVVDPNEERQDREWRATFLTSVPISADWSVIATLQRTVVESNFKNFTYTNTAASIGAAWRF
jgi:tetratricopeptide (TPR) repeat protein